MPRIILAGPSQRAYAHRAIDEAPPGAVVSISTGKRGLTQSNLFHAWMGQISKARGDVTEGRVKAECHIEWGIPILRAEDPDYDEFIVAALGGRTYAECCKIIEKGYVHCSSLMDKTQMRRYMDAVWIEYAPHVRLMNPDDLKYGEQHSPEKRSGKTPEARAHLEAVKGLPCVVCGAHGAEAHHCRSGPYAAGKRASDFCTIPLCVQCHRIGPRSYHGGKRPWQERNGMDFEHLEQVRAALGLPATHPDDKHGEQT